jgi:hypothetical protein
MDEWIKKLRYKYIMEYYSVIKKSDSMPFTGKWMELEVITLSEISQTEKDKYCMFCYMQHLHLKEA